MKEILKFLFILYLIFFQAVGLGCRFLKLPGILSLGGQTTSAILQRLSIIRDEIEMNDGEQFAWPKQHEFLHIRSSIDSIGTRKSYFINSY